MMRLARLRSLPREGRDTLFTLLLIAWIVLPQLGHLPLWCSAVIVLVLIWRSVLALRNAPLPKRRWLILLLAVAVMGTLATFRTLAGPDAGVALLVLLLALKTLELRARRDALVIFFLGFFTVLTGFLQSQSLLTAAWMLLALLGLLTALINAQRPVGTPQLQESALTAMRLTAAGLPVMIALFLFFPRLDPLWSMPADESAGRSGLSEDMQVGQVARLALDDAVAFRVRFDSAAPAQQQLYFRGPVLERFDGQTWRAAAHGFGGGATAATLQVGDPALDYTVTLEPNNQRWLLALDATPSAPQTTGDWRIQQLRTFEWQTDRPITQLLRYTARSHMQYRYGGPSPSALGANTARTNLTLPRGFNPRTQALANQLRASAGDSDEAVVQAALQRLRADGYRYTLEPGLTGRHAADEFWFDTQEGFCEHIASAFVILMRGAGIPARIVTGFQGAEHNAVGDYWVVRNSNAHAWAEVWLADRGWARIDPTAAVMPARVGQAQRLRAPTGRVATALGTFNPRLWRRMQATWDAVNNSWNQWVLAYSGQTQLNLLQKLGIQAPEWADLIKVLAALLAAGALAVALMSGIRHQRQDPWLRLLERARHRLRRQGVAAAPNTVPRELAALVAQSALPSAQQRAWQQWLAALEHWRYAPDHAAARPSLATLKQSLRRQ